MLIYFVIHPIYMMTKGGPDYVIEYFGSVTKLVLLILAKKVLRASDSSYVVYAAIVLTL